MGRKRHSAEEIVNKLRQAEVELDKGKSIAEACKHLGVSESSSERNPWKAVAFFFSSPRRGRSDRTASHAACRARRCLCPAGAERKT